jgi:hypothetical protein
MKGEKRSVQRLGFERQKVHVSHPSSIYRCFRKSLNLDIIARQEKEAKLHRY